MEVKTPKGYVSPRKLFIAQSKTYSVNINFDVKCIYSDEYGINNIDSLRGFINGIAAGNYDIEYIFIDGVARIAKEELSQLESVFEAASKLTEITFVFTVSASADEIPEFLKKYI